MNIKKEIAKQLGKQRVLGIRPATLTLYTAGTRTVGNLAAGTQPTSTAYACKAFREPIKRLIDGSLVVEGRSVLSILGGSIASAAEPVPGATVTFAGVVHRVHRVVSDPVDALFQCEVSH